MYCEMSKSPIRFMFVREMSVKITSLKQMAPKSHETRFSFVKESVSSCGSLGTAIGYRKNRLNVMSVSKMKSKIQNKNVHRTVVSYCINEARLT